MAEHPLRFVPSVESVKSVVRPPFREVCRQDHKNLPKSRESRVAKRNEKSRPGFRAGGVRAEPGAGLARRALVARSAVPAGTAAVAPLSGRRGCAGKRDSGFGG